MKKFWKAGVALIIALAACAPSLPASSDEHAALLPASAVLDLSAVRTFFPSVTHLAQTGADGTAQGKPTATRSVFYENGDGTKRVTISVDAYRSRADSKLAYETALQKSKIPGYRSLPAPNLGQSAFAGTVTMKGETHVGIGVLVGNRIVGATLAGFEASPAIVSKLFDMTRKQLTR